MSQRTCRETATWIEHIAAAAHLVSHPSLCRNFRPDSHSIGLSPSPVPKHSVGKARLNIPPLPCTFTAEEVLSHDQNTARGHDSSRAWQTINQTMPRIVPIALYIGSMLLLLLFALRRKHNRIRGDNALIWPVSNVLMTQSASRNEMKLFWWPIEDQHCSDSGGCDECWFVCILTGPKRK